MTKSITVLEIKVSCLRQHLETCYTILLFRRLTELWTLKLNKKKKNWKNPNVSSNFIVQWKSYSKFRGIAVRRIFQSSRPYKIHHTFFNVFTYVWIFTIFKNRSTWCKNFVLQSFNSLRYHFLSLCVQFLHVLYCILIYCIVLYYIILYFWNLSNKDYFLS